jgi:hypothetical protein
MKDARCMGLSSRKQWNQFFQRWAKKAEMPCRISAADVIKQLRACERPAQLFLNLVCEICPAMDK